MNKLEFGLEAASLREGCGVRRSALSAHWLRAGGGWLLACLLISSLAPSVRGAQKDGSQAVFLVARREIHGPIFGHSVVLMLPTAKSPLIVGLIVNKPTRMTLGKLFPGSPDLQVRTEPAYFGGPVDVGVPSAIFHSSTAPPRALHVYGNVYLTFDSGLISKVFKRAQTASLPHLYLGRAQWSPAQLKNEIARGSWYRVRADGNLIFSTNLQGLWRKLHDQAAPSKYIQYRLPDGTSRATVLKIALTD